MRGDLENIVTLLILALLGGGIQAVKAWLERKQEPSAPKEGGNSTGASGGMSDTDAEKEAKMRRFMEALGLPADEVLPPQQPPPHRAAPTTAPTDTDQPTASTARTAPTAHPMGPGPHPWAPTKPPTASAGEERSYEERMAARRRELEQLKKARAARKQTARPPSAPPSPAAVPTSQQASRHEQAPPKAYSFDAATRSTRSPSHTHRIEKRPASKAGKTPAMASAAPLRESLRNPAELRRAFVLKEILGRPKALESLEERPA